ncbi:glycoside hydrolase family 15 protein [Lactifluus subvellereus]|nr:glycoside hydrolase family 15 protein [Lactifluus subvellereus]
MNLCDPNQPRDYIPISDHALIGNLRTAALVSTDGSIESYCVPNFDSPSVFARILDKDKGGHFSISPRAPFTTKQNYLPNSNVVQTKFLNEEGVVCVTDFLPRNPAATAQKPLLHWLIRRVEVVRGVQSMRVECAPAFNYALAEHRTSLVPDDTIPANGEHAPEKQKKALFESSGLTLDLRFVAESVVDGVPSPTVELRTLDLRPWGHKGISISADLDLVEGQVVTFVLRTPPSTTTHQHIPNPTNELAQQLGLPFDQLLRGTTSLRNKEDPLLTKNLLHDLLRGTNDYWNAWVRRSTYDGSWKEAVHRSALALKLLIYEPTGAVVASPTFSLPEFIGGTRNWDYRASWIRDASFTLYALLRLGFTHEADSYMEFICDRLKDKNPDGSLQIMYTIHGEKIFLEEELAHLDGHKGSKPVRIGNGAIDHIQLDIYGELMDCIYLGQKFGKPLAYDTWVAVRELVDFVVAHYNDPDLSIWSVRVREVVNDVLTSTVHGREVRNKERHFTYSKKNTVFHSRRTRVAIDRGLRLADKRSLPCPRRNQWLVARDELYEQIMQKAWNPEKKFFAQSYDEIDVLDSAVLIMPLVFFCTASDPRFRSTLDAILKSPERGGLTANNLVYRYNTAESDDGVGGEEGTFCLCTLWCIEALTRAGEFDKAACNSQSECLKYETELAMMDFLQYTNHVGLCTEEISPAGEGLGNAVQGFTHVTLISAAFNLSRTMKRRGL